MFSAYIELFESQNGTGIEQPEGPDVLITRLDRDAHFYAVERVREGIYSLCRLGQWVDIGQLQAAAHITLKRSPRELEIAHTVESERRWWHTAILSVPRDEHRGKRRKGECSPQAYLARPQLPLPEDYTRAGAQEMPAEDFNELSVSVSKDESPAYPLEVRADLQVVSTHLVNQYLEALYLSKTSLAYFAKGPLSRARAASNSDQATAVQKQDLAQFIRSMILTMIAMDKKYKERIPSTIKLLTQRILPVTSTSAVTAKPIKVRTGKKLKLGKDGFYAVEESFLEKWLLDDDSDPNSTDAPRLENGKPSLNTKVAELRLRENLLQLILILEVLAIEASETVETPLATEPCTMDSQICTQEVGTKAKRPRVKRPQDIKITLDMLIDRLCIWQSVNADEDSGIDRKSEVRPCNNVASKALATTRASDQLKDFCREVAIPL